MEQVVDLVRTESSNEVLVELSHGRSPAGYREEWEIDAPAATEATTKLRAAWWADDDADTLLRQPLVSEFVRIHLRAASGRRRPLALLDLLDEIVQWSTLPPVRRQQQAAGLLQRFEQLAPAPTKRGWQSLRKRTVSSRGKGGSGGGGSGSGSGGEDSSRASARQKKGVVDAWQSCAMELRATLAGGEAESAEQQKLRFDALLQLIGRDLRSSCADFLQSKSCASCGEYLSLLQHSVTHESFNHIRPIGKGGYGQVWASIKRDSGAGYAIKVMGRRRVVSKKAESHLLSELRCMRLVTSDFVCALHYAYATPDSICLVLEWLRGGSLQFHLKQRRVEVDRKQRALPFSEQEVVFYAGCVVLGLEAMHAAQIVYRDLKPDNLLLSHEGYVKLTDLGMAQAVPPGGTVSGKSGTRGFWPPEMIRRQPYRFEPDWWTLGVTLHCLLATHSPFSLDEAIKRGMPGTRPPPHKDDLDARKALHDRVVLDHSPPPPPLASPRCAQFLAALLNKDKTQRLGTAGGAHQVMSHRFFDDVDWLSLRAGSLPPPLVPSTDAVHAGSIAEVGEVEQPEVELDAAHFERFSSWCPPAAPPPHDPNAPLWPVPPHPNARPPCVGREYRNEELMQREIAEAVRTDAAQQTPGKLAAADGQRHGGCVIA